MKVLRTKLSRLEAAREARPAPTIILDPAEAAERRIALLALAADWHAGELVEMPGELADRLDGLNASVVLACDLPPITLDDLERLEHAFVCRHLPLPWAELAEPLREAHREAFKVYPAHFPPNSDAPRLRCAADGYRRRTGVDVSPRMVELAVYGV